MTQINQSKQSEANKRHYEALASQSGQLDKVQASTLEAVDNESLF
jgi:hypothetical protein